MNAHSRIVNVLAVLILLVSISAPNVLALAEEKSLKDLSKESEKGKTERHVETVIKKSGIEYTIQIPESDFNGDIAIEPSLSDGAPSVIKYEGFEGVFPNTWILTGSPTWCKTDYKPAVGAWSGWPACAGTGAVPAGGLYPNNVNSWMVYGPFSLVGVTNASITFKHWTDTEVFGDYFIFSISPDNFFNYWCEWGYSGDFTPWKKVTIDLKNALGVDLRGEPNVWIKFGFTSDSAVQDYGTFLDEIKIIATYAPRITVRSPNGGETWVRGTTHTLRWNSTGGPGTNVSIKLLKSGGGVETITSNTPNDGSYPWTISTERVLGSDYKIKVTSTSNSAYNDTSDNNFTIGGINVISPNGGNNWVRGTTRNVRWSSLGSPGANVSIKLINSSGVIETIASNTPNDGLHPWTIPLARVLASDYKIRVASTSNVVYKDVSDNNFTIS